MSQLMTPATTSGLLYNANVSFVKLSKPYTQRRFTPIICTIGPRTQKVEMILQLIQTGLNVARLNCSHGDHAYHEQTIRNVREAAVKLNRTSIGIALDTRGPEIRTGNFVSSDGAMIHCGDTVTLMTDLTWENQQTPECIFVDYSHLPQIVKPGNHVFVDDGVLSLLVKECSEKTVTCVAESTHYLTNRKGCNLPGLCIDLPAVSEKDRKDILFGAQQGVDFIFASFIRTAEQVRDVRRVLTETGIESAKDIRIIAKIENLEGLENIRGILEEADGIMVARGDLGVEIPGHIVAAAQKKIIAMCNMVGKPVICATQMLESMTHNPRPTRAEAGDVINAVLDGADAVMLSGETAAGQFPIEAVKEMSQLCHTAQRLYRSQHLSESIKAAQEHPMPVFESICSASVYVAFELNAKAIVILSDTTRSVQLIAKYRPPCMTVCVTRSQRGARQKALLRGVAAFYFKDDEHISTHDERVTYGIRRAVDKGILKAGDLVVAVHCYRHGDHRPNATHILSVPSSF